MNRLAGIIIEIRGDIYKVKTKNEVIDNVYIKDKFPQYSHVIVGDYLKAFMCSNRRVKVIIRPEENDLLSFELYLRNVISNTKIHRLYRYIKDRYRLTPYRYITLNYKSLTTDTFGGLLSYKDVTRLREHWLHTQINRLPQLIGLTMDEVQDIIHNFGIETFINRFFNQPYYFYTISNKRLAEVCNLNSITVEPLLYRYHNIANMVYNHYINGNTSLRYDNIDKDTIDRLRDIYNITYYMGCLYLNMSLLTEYTVAQWLCRNKVDIIVGRAGTGKTTRIRSIIGPDTVLLAYTGKAAARLKEVTGHPSSTIHRLLHNRNQVNVKHIVIDEASMLPTELFYNLILRYPRFHLTLVGDEDQLPPISGGCFLIQLLKSGKFPVTRLTEVVRTDRKGIIDNIDRYMRGDTIVPNEDFHIVDSLDAVIDLWVANKVDVAKTVVITPYIRDRQLINSMVRSKFHPNAMLVTDGIYINDRVTVEHNDYTNDVMHGDEGLVVGYDYKNSKVMVKFGDRVVSIQPSELSVTFALTIHSSQGSEWDYVAIYIPPDCTNFLDDRMIYTAITRSKYKVWVVGNIPKRWRRPDPHDNLSVRIV